jgi:ABC-type transporter lipoprotein component MlaA
MQRAQRADVKGAGRDLLQSMARLDDEYEHGTVAADTYQQRRQAYKEQLCKLVEELQRNEASPKAMATRGRAV